MRVNVEKDGVGEGAKWKYESRCRVTSAPFRDPSGLHVFFPMVRKI